MRIGSNHWILLQPDQVSNNRSMASGTQSPIATCSSQRSPPQSSNKQKMEESQTAVIPSSALIGHKFSIFAYRAHSHALTVSLYLFLLKPQVVSLGVERYRSLSWIYCLSCLSFSVPLSPIYSIFMHGIHVYAHLVV